MSEVKCPWCALKSGPCELEPCDFKDLPYEREEIVARVKREVEAIGKLKREVSLTMGKEAAHKVMFEIVDRSKGLDIMATALKKDFAMPEEEVKELFVGVGKAKLDAKKEMFKRLRAKK